jgi:hypothetical protein
MRAGSVVDHHVVWRTDELGVRFANRKESDLAREEKELANS